MKRMIWLPTILNWTHGELSWFKTDKCSGVWKTLRGRSGVATLSHSEVTYVSRAQSMVGTLLLRTTNQGSSNILSCFRRLWGQIRKTRVAMNLCQNGAKMVHPPWGLPNSSSASMHGHNCTSSPCSVPRRCPSSMPSGQRKVFDKSQPSE